MSSIFHSSLRQLTGSRSLGLCLAVFMFITLNQYEVEWCSIWKYIMEENI